MRMVLTEIIGLQVENRVSFEVDNFTSPAYVARLDYRGVPGLRIGGSFYYCVNTASNSDKVATYAGVKAPLRIYTVDGQYKNKYITARTNFVFGNLTGATAISNKNKGLSNSSPYTRVVQVAKRAVSYAGEVGINLRSICNDSKKVPVIYPFARYEYYNPQEEGEKRPASYGQEKSGEYVDCRPELVCFTQSGGKG